MLAGVQSVLLAGVLLWAAVLKLRGGAASRSALSRLVGKDRVVSAFRLIGIVELALVVGLLLPNPVTPWASFAWCLGMLGYLTWARRTAPDASCGCLSEKHAPIGARGLARAGLLAVAALFAGPWPSILDSPVASAGLLVLETGVVVALSAELDDYWLLPLRRWRVRIRHPLANSQFEVPVASTVQQLQKSQAYQSVYPLLRSDLLDTWDEGEWRILTYSAVRDGDRATAVFAVPRLRYEPNDVRVALA
jgi:hypothetical protein